METGPVPRSSHVPSRLKGIETEAPPPSSSLSSCSHVPSRLKGIETRYALPQGTSAEKFTCAFPFEGN